MFYGDREDAASPSELGWTSGGVRPPSFVGVKNTPRFAASIFSSVDEIRSGRRTFKCLHATDETVQPHRQRFFFGGFCVCAFVRGSREGGEDLRFDLGARWEADRRQDWKLVSNDKWEKCAAWSCDGCGGLVPVAVKPLCVNTVSSGLLWLILFILFGTPHSTTGWTQRGIPDVQRLHNSSAPRGDQSDQSLPVAARGRAFHLDPRSRRRYSEQLHNRCLFSSKKKNHIFHERCKHSGTHDILHHLTCAPNSLSRHEKVASKLIFGRGGVCLGPLSSSLLI